MYVTCPFFFLSIMCYTQNGILYVLLYACLVASFSVVHFLSRFYNPVCFLGAMLLASCTVESIHFFPAHCPLQVNPSVSLLLLYSIDY